MTTQPGAEQQLQRALLALLLCEFPRKLERLELGWRICIGERLTVAINELHQAGLVWCEGDYVMPTLPARHMDWLDLV
ncbi:MAG TPA: hypothetical protein VF009_02530 [Solirubrobacterales bacterium]